MPILPYLRFDERLLWCNIVRHALQIKEERQPNRLARRRARPLPLNDFLKPKSVGRWADDDVETDARTNLQLLACVHVRTLLEGAI